MSMLPGSYFSFLKILYYPVNLGRPPLEISCLIPLVHYRGEVNHNGLQPLKTSWPACLI